MSSLPVTLLPVTPGDFESLARLEQLVFKDDAWSTIAYGADWTSEGAVASMVDDFARGHNSAENTDSAGSWQKIIKAVIKPNNEICGYAEWSFDDGKEVKKEASDESSAGSWPPGANVRFCEDAYIVADEWMKKSCEGKPFMKLRTLSILPKYQRRGVGTSLLKEFIAEVDRLGVQAVLGASKEGEALYRRFGFEEVVAMELDLRKYSDGSEEDLNLGIEKHLVMRRPPRI